MSYCATQLDLKDVVFLHPPTLVLGLQTPAIYLTTKSFLYNCLDILGLLCIYMNFEPSK